MTADLYSVEQVADLLNLHVRTVRGYVREGRLKAVRIGKQYRIAREDLEAMTGRPAAALVPEPASRERHVEASTIVEIDVISPDAVQRLSNTLSGAAMSHRGVSHRGEPLRIETIYNEVRAHLKIILVGDLRTVAGLLELVHAVLESQA
jgi:excisionase family DNA binding protein